MQLSKVARAAIAIMMLASTPSLWAGAEDVKGIDIIVKKQPTGRGSAAIAATSDEAGRVRFEILEAGTYSIEAFTPLPGEERFAVRDIRLFGRFRPKTPGSGEIVTGKTVDGNSLFAAGMDRGDRSASFSSTFVVNEPVTFIGRIDTDPEVTIDARHLTFHAVVNGPQPFAQTVRIFNGSASAVGYTAAFETVGARWSASLSKSSGSITGLRTDSIELRPAAGLPEGQYNGFLRVQLQTEDGPLERVAAVTLFVQQSETSKATTRLDGPMQALYPLPSGGYEAPLLVSNNSATPQTYGLEPDSWLTFTPSRMTLNPGETGAFTVQLSAAEAEGANSGWQKRCIWVVDLNQPLLPRLVLKCYWVWVGGNAALGAACTPTQLQPVITGMNPPFPRAGHPLDVTVQVFDNCGGQIDDFTAILRGHNGEGQSHITAVRSSGKAVKKAGEGGGSFLVSGPRTIAQNALASNEPELRIEAYLYAYFLVGDAGLTLQVDVEAPNPAGGDILIGSVDMPLPFDSEPDMPLVAQGAFVKNVNFEVVPLERLEVFSLFTVIPGLARESAQAVPFPFSLGGVQLLIDGTANVPLIRVANGQIAGIVPDLSAGTHIVNILYKDRMSGAIEFRVDDVNPSPLFINAATGTPHLYDRNGRRVTQDNPVRAGQTFIFYASGLGRMIGIDQIAGAPAPAVRMEPEQPCKLNIGGNAPVLVFCGRVQRAIALDQVNFRLNEISAPSALPGDIVQIPIALDQGGHKGSVNALGWFEVTTVQSTVDISVQANYPDAQFNVDNQLITGNTGILTFNSGAPIPLDVPPDPQQPSAGTRYSFSGWSQGGARQQTISPTVGTAYGAYFLASYLLTVNGMAAADPPSPDGYYMQTANSFIPVTVNGFCAGGGAPIGLLVST